MIKLFELGENGMVSLNKVWISLIPEFKKILNRDRGSDGDSHGRYKKQATKEFTYMFLLYDFHSPYENYTETDRIEAVEGITGLNPKIADKDEELGAAIDKYKEMLDNCSPALRGLRTMKKAADKMYDYFDSIDYREIDMNGKLVHDVKKVQESITKMPYMNEAIKKQEAIVKQELEGDTGLRGDQEKGYDEDPDYDGEDF